MAALKITLANAESVNAQMLENRVRRLERQKIYAAYCVSVKGLTKPREGFSEVAPNFSDVTFRL